MKKDREFYMDQFKSEECLCGRTKRPWNAFCYTCYQALPWTMKNDLWKSFGHGYEEAYDEAAEYLN
ncbi:hypothetical protein LCGC14_0384190 [marine sediment metagenome]|uniref:Uncharacterized protein n=1 Tax=marine sediment metagenome TaxID=412755 RepID=A0A0F9T194_9ZZZZ